MFKRICFLFYIRPLELTPAPNEVDGDSFILNWTEPYNKEIHTDQLAEVLKVSAIFILY